MSESLKDKVFSQGVTGGNKAHIENVNQNQTINNNFTDRDFFFDISLKTENGMELTINEKLETDKIYLLIISVQPNSVVKSNLLQRGLKIIKQLDLYLQADDFYILDHRIISLQLKDWDTWKEQFIVKVRNCTHGKASLSLYFREGKAEFARYASLLEVQVCSVGNPITQPKYVNLTANIANAENAVILYVIPNGEKEWLIKGFSPHESILGAFNQTIKAPNIDVNIWQHYVPKKLGSLVKWLRETIAYFQNQCNLAIVDLTSQQISWERIELKKNIYLGVEAKVVRWVEQEARGEKILLDLAQPRIYQGRLVDYKHPRDLNCDDIDNALNSWRQGLSKHKQQPVAVGLLNCHQRLTNISFEKVARKVTDYSLFLFANCPYSACVIWEDESPSGIAANALYEVASGYLGTMGEIDTVFAEHLQAKFLELARQRDGVKPVDFLRRLRVTYAKMLLSDDDRKIERAERLLPYAFSYVYYGNPDDVVKITEGGQL